jgi:hypothetical protein
MGYAYMEKQSTIIDLESSGSRGIIGLEMLFKTTIKRASPGANGTGTTTIVLLALYA